MNPRSHDLWSQVEELFHAAQQQPTEARDAWVDLHEESIEVRNEVKSLLAGFETQEKRGQRGADSENPAAGVTSLPAARFGPYRLIKLIGRGGMGAVYLARRADGQFDQTVALKMMAAHLSGDEFLARFHRERQLLASLEHPHITRLLDGGVSSLDDPYLVMEFVDGLALASYCDERKLDIAARLRIFLQVCSAVDYAHRNLIVHRDLKPANILVNAEGTAKLLDFGTAALLEGAIHVTETRHRMVTPRYCSPEQLRGDRVNTSTDIYSSGIILYELLTGSWPFGDPESLLTELNRATGNATAIPLATAITVDSAEQRSVSREQLARTLKGDLSAIVMKAIEADPSQRYESIQQFSADIENYLGGRPVLAHPQTAIYRAGKFLRRRWFAVGAAVVFVIGISLAALVATYQARLARERYADLRSLTTSLLFELKDAISDVPGATKAQQILVNRVVKNLDKLSQSSDDPDLQLELAEAFRQLGELQGDPYVQNLNDTAGALANLAKARGIADHAAKSRPKDDPRWLRLAGLIEQDVGEVHFGMGQAEEAVANLTAACSYFERMIPKTTNPAWLADAATAHGSLGDILGQPGTSSLNDVTKAAAEYRRVIDLDEMTLKIAPDAVRSRRGMALMHMKLGDLIRHRDPATALDYFEQAIRQFQALPPEELNKPATQRLRWYIIRKKGICLGDLDQWADAQTVLLQVIAFYQSRAAEDPNDSRAIFDVTVAMDDFGEQLFRDGDNVKASAYVEQIIPLLETLRRVDPANLVWRQNLAHQRSLRGTLLARLGHPQQALPISKAALEDEARLAADPNASRLVLSTAIEDLRSVEPVELRDPTRCLEFAQRNAAAGQQQEPYALYLLAMAYRQAGRLEEARVEAARALAMIAPPKGALVSYMRRELETIH